MTPFPRIQALGVLNINDPTRGLMHLVPLIYIVKEMGLKRKLATIGHMVQRNSNPYDFRGSRACDAGANGNTRMLSLSVLSPGRWSTLPRAYLLYCFTRMSSFGRSTQVY